MEDSRISNRGKDILTNMSIEFNTIIEKYGFWAGVYANKYWFNNYLYKNVLDSKYTLWVAQYSNNCDLDIKNKDIWQNSDKGLMIGIIGNVDTNYMYRDLISEIGKHQEINQEPPIIENMPVQEIKLDYQVGDVVEVSSYYASSTDTVDKAVIRNATGTITKVLYNGAQNPYLLNNGGIGWCNAGDIRRIIQQNTKEIEYFVKRGDTLSEIAEEFNTTVDEIVKYNNIRNPNKIYVNQKLLIKLKG